MTTLYTRQSSSADVRRSDTQGLLIITAIPAGASESLLGKPLLAAGALTVAGTYSCDIDTYDWSALEVVLMASAITGTVTPHLRRMYASRAAVRSSTSGVGMSAGVSQTLSTSTVVGTQRFRLDLVIAGGGAATFDAGTDPTSPTALAEFNGA